MSCRLLCFVCWLFTTLTAKGGVPSICIEPSQSDSLSCSISFIRAGNLIVVKAKVDSSEGNFILDTGAPGLVLNATYFRDYPITEKAQTDNIGIGGGSQEMIKTTAAEVSFGSLKFSRVLADLGNLGNIENAKGIKILGLLGVELFKQMALVIDFEKNLIHIHRVNKKKGLSCGHNLFTESDQYNAYPIELISNRIVATAKVAGKKLKLVVDCAAESSILDSRLPNAIFEEVTITGKVKVSGAGDRKADALYGNLRSMKMGNESFANLRVIILNLEYTCFSDTYCANGVLGFDFLSRHKIAFNFVTGKMYVWQ